MTSQLCGRPRARRRPAQCTRAASIEGCGRRSATSRTSPSRAFSSRHHARGPHDAAQGCRGFADVIDQLAERYHHEVARRGPPSGCGRAAMEPSQYLWPRRQRRVSERPSHESSRVVPLRSRSGCGRPAAWEPARFPKISSPRRAPSSSMPSRWGGDNCVDSSSPMAIRSASRSQSPRHKPPNASPESTSARCRQTT